MPITRAWLNCPTGFLLYYPLKQGLKHMQSGTLKIGAGMFLLYYPLKQGLKLSNFCMYISSPIKVFTLLSIKTRIETSHEKDYYLFPDEFLLYYPLKQGLKPTELHILCGDCKEFLLYYPLKQGLKHNKFMVFPIVNKRGFYSTIH